MKKRKRRFKEGIHNSPKCKKPISYRSGLEERFCIMLDLDPNVIEYEYETVVIPYKTKPTAKKIRRYFPDFLIRYSDGIVKMVEVKAKNFTTAKSVLKKAEYAIKWCEERGILYEIWTEKSILSLEKLQKQNPNLLLSENESPKNQKSPKKKSPTKKPSPKKSSTPRKRVKALF